MKQAARGRLYQDSEFEFKEFNGLKIEQLIVCENPDTGEPIIVYIKVENKSWHQFFLDAGLGFLEDWGEIDVDDESYDFIDVTEKWNLKNKLICGIHCKPDINNSRIIIELESQKKIILKCVKPEIFDSECELITI